MPISNIPVHIEVEVTAERGKNQRVMNLVNKLLKEKVLPENQNTHSIESMDKFFLKNVPGIPNFLRIRAVHDKRKNRCLIELKNNNPIKGKGESEDMYYSVASNRIVALDEDEYNRKVEKINKFNIKKHSLEEISLHKINYSIGMKKKTGLKETPTEKRNPKKIKEWIREIGKKGMILSKKLVDFLKKYINKLRVKIMPNKVYKVEKLPNILSKETEDLVVKQEKSTVKIKDKLQKDIIGLKLSKEEEALMLKRGNSAVKTRSQLQKDLIGLKLSKEEKALMLKQGNDVIEKRRSIRRKGGREKVM